MRCERSCVASRKMTIRAKKRLRAGRLTSVLIFVLLSGFDGSDAAPRTEISSQKNVPVLRDEMMGQVGASVLGESALVDKESGRVLWEGGSSTLSASLAPFLGSSGIKHVRATILTGIFLLALIGSIVARIRSCLFAESNGSDSRSWLMTALLFAADWTVLRIPQVNTNILIASILLYFVESYTCSTRRYLANALSSPVEVEEYIEQLRREAPLVSWRVRCYHYERRRWLSILSYLSTIVKFLTLKREEYDSIEQVSESTAVEQSSWWLTRKVVTHQAVSNYTYTSCEDKTTAGVWRRAEATAITPAPFSKILLSKLLILPNAKAREDYFKQQSTFVTREGRDEFTEFSTSIQVNSFQRRMLAVRPVEGVPSAKLFRLHLFWVFSLVGLTVPYRIWFSRHCDELKVTVAKETSCEKAGSSSWNWFSKSTSKHSSEWNKEFKSKMRDLALYAKGELLPITDSSNETIADLPTSSEADVISNIPATNFTVNETTIETATPETNKTQDNVDDEPSPPGKQVVEKTLSNDEADSKIPFNDDNGQ